MTVLRANGVVLVVDDDPAVGKVLSAQLEQAGVEVHQARSGDEALLLLGARPIDVVVSDVRMPGMDGMQLLSEVSRRWPEVPVVLITAHGTIALAVEAMKAGALDFVTKPFDREEILYTVKKALAEARHAEKTPPTARVSAGFVGTAPAMKEVHDLIRRAAASTATVLVRGESGTGKELVARAIHDASARAKAPFVKIHCAALPDTLLESELWGYEKGAFTGASSRKPGRVELADGGTLFLDEIGDITPATQVKLLRLLQDREMERLGSIETLKVDIRFVAATHRDLEAMIPKAEFRADLFYRLNVVPIVLPPLRGHPEDVEPLAVHFCKIFGAAAAKPDAVLESGALALLRAQSWPGNVRELQNFVERLVVLSDGPRLSEADVERELSRTPPATTSPALGASAPAAGSTLESQRQKTERDAIQNALRQAGNNRTVAARLLGISRRTLYHKLDELGLLQ